MKRMDILSKLRSWFIPTTIVGAIFALGFWIYPDPIFLLDEALVAFLVTRVENKLGR